MKQLRSNIGRKNLRTSITVIQPRNEQQLALQQTEELKVTNLNADWSALNTKTGQLSRLGTETDESEDIRSFHKMAPSS